jgi:putative oxidoreductase
MNRTLVLLSRFALAAIFVVTGAQKLQNFRDTARIMDHMGIPLATLLLAIAVLLEVGGGFMIALGWRARWAAGALFVYLIPVTIYFHIAEGFDLIQTLKNLAILGALLRIAADGAGAESLDEWGTAKAARSESA